MQFDPLFQDQLRALFRWRRDVRHFRPDPLPPGTLDALIATANLAPSVGLSQPWRFVVVANAARRRAVRDVFADCNRDALADYRGDRANRYAALKLAGLDNAPVQFALFADRGARQGHGLGRRTMPEMAEYSAVTAAHTLWLAARAQGLGLGWLSILDPARMAVILDVPPDWRLIGYFCLGVPARDTETPELERMGWETRRPPMVLHR